MKPFGFLRSATSTLAINVAMMVLNGAMGVIAARALGPEGLGTFAIAMLIPNLASLFLQLGIGMATVYFMGQKKYPADVLAGNVLSVSIVTSVIVLPVYVLCIPFLQRTVAVGIDADALVLIGASIPFALISRHLLYIFLGLQHIDGYNQLRVLRAAANLVLLVVAVIVLGMGATGAVWSVTLGWLIMALYGLWALRKVISVRLYWSGDVLRDCLKLGLQGFLSNLFQFFNYRLDVLILSFFLGVTAVGIYSTAVTIAEMLWYVPEAIATVLFPKTAASSTEELRSFTPIVTRNVFVFTLLTSILMAAFSYPVVTIIFGGRYVDSVLPLQLLLPGVVLLSVNKVLASDLAGRGLLLYNTVASLVGLFATVVLDVVLIPLWGISGAAVASSVSYILSTLVVLVLYVRVSGNRPREVLIPEAADRDLFRTIWRRFLGLFPVGTGR